MIDDDEKKREEERKWNKLVKRYKCMDFVDNDSDNDKRIRVWIGKDIVLSLS